MSMLKNIILRSFYPSTRSTRWFICDCKLILKKRSPSNSFSHKFIWKPASSCGLGTDRSLTFRSYWKWFCLYLFLWNILGRSLLGNHMAKAHISTQRIASSSNIWPRKLSVAWKYAEPTPSRAKCAITNIFIHIHMSAAIKKKKIEGKCTDSFKA